MLVLNLKKNGFKELMSDEDMRISVVFVGGDYGLVIVAHATVTPEYLPENVLTPDSIWETGYGRSLSLVCA